MMTESMFDGTMDTVFDAIAEANLMDSGLLLLLRSMLGQRNASEICNLTKEQLRLELWLRTDEKIGDFTTVEAARMLRSSIDQLSVHDTESSEPVEEQPVVADSLNDFSIVVPNGSQDFETVSSDIVLDGENVGTARSTSGDITIRNAAVENVRSTSGDIKMNNVILFGSCRTTSGDIKGKFYLAPGATVQTTSGDIRAKCTRLTGEEVKNMISFHARTKPNSKVIGDLRRGASAGGRRETVTITKSHKHVDYFMLNDQFAVCNHCGIANNMEEFNSRNACPNCGK